MAKDETLGKIIRKYREDKKLTQEELSRYIHKSDKYIGAVECGRINPTYPVLKDIVLALGIDGNLVFYENASKELSNIAEVYLRKMDATTQKLAVEILQVMANSQLNKNSEKSKK